MAMVKYSGREWTLEDGESVLECLLRNGVEYPHSCQAGVCQSCVMRSESVVDASWQAGISDTLKSERYFLACLARPHENLVVSDATSAINEVKAQVISLAKLNQTVLQMKLSTASLESWTPGKYLSLINSEGICRSYSIANIPIQDGYIELHVRLKPEGRMSQWLENRAHVGDRIQLKGPFGNCFYVNPQHRVYPILLVGTGTGLAPLVGLARDALMQGHSGDVTLLHGSLTSADVYYTDELAALSHEYPQFRAIRCVLHHDDTALSESIDHAVLKYLDQPSALHVMICGPAEMTQQLKTIVFCAGVPSRQILSDAFR